MEKTSIQRKGKGGRETPLRGPCLGVTAGGPDVGGDAGFRRGANFPQPDGGCSLPLFSYIPSLATFFSSVQVWHSSCTCVVVGAAFLSEWQAQTHTQTSGENKMNTLKKLILGMGLVSVLCAIPAMAQIANSVTFDAPSAFYAGNAKMPAGSYRLTQPDADSNLLLLESASGSHSVFVEYEVVSSETRHTQSDVTFNKYGNVDFLSAIWFEGRKSEMQILPTKFEQNTAKAATAEKHSLSAKSAGQP